MTVIGEINALFNNCKVLSNFKIGKGVSKIGAKAFAECPSIKKLLIPSNVVVLGRGCML